MILRPYEEKDRESCVEILGKYGIPEEGMRFEDPGSDTRLLEDDGKVLGFFTIKPFNETYTLEHLALGKSNLHNAKLLERFLRTTLIIEKNCGSMIIALDKNNKRLQEVVEFQYNVKPYSENEEHYFYKVSFLEGV